MFYPFIIFLQSFEISGTSSISNAEYIKNAALIAHWGDNDNFPTYLELCQTSKDVGWYVIATEIANQMYNSLELVTQAAQSPILY
jgi:hypothetical protein